MKTKQTTFLFSIENLRIRKSSTN